MARFCICWAGNLDEWMDGNMTSVEADDVIEAMTTYTERLDDDLRRAIRKDFHFHQVTPKGEVVFKGESGDAFIEVWKSQG